MTPLLIFSKLWFLILFMINPRLIFIALGFFVGGVATLENRYVHSLMVEVQSFYHETSDSIMNTGEAYTPQLNTETVRESYENTKDQFDFNR